MATVLEQKTILLVEDSGSTRKVLRSVLEDAGYCVIEAEDGQKGLARIADNPRIHLIISDVNMPNMDGIRFVQAVKAQPSYQFVPVIMLTTESQETKKLQGQVAGAKAWIVKPFKPEMILRAVAKLIHV